MSEERRETHRSRAQRAEEFLCDLLAQPLDADGVRAAWRRSPFRDERGLEVELEELLEVRGRLDRSGRDAREVLAAAARSAGAPGEVTVERFFEPRLRACAPPRRVGARRFQLLAALAALAAIVLCVLWARGPQARDQDPQLPQFLGEEDNVVLLQPVGSVQDWDAFRWRAERADECWFELTVRTDDGRELAHVADLDGEEWRPDDSSSWPSRVSWELAAYDADGRVGTWTAEAWRR